jgi:hypothetical protein
MQIKFSKNALFKKNNLAEIYSQSDFLLEFSIIYRNRILFPFVKCKDFIQDFIFIENKKFKDVRRIYGFKWKNKDIIDKSKRFQIGCKQTNNKANTYESIISSLKFIRQIEKHLGLSSTIVKKYKNKNIICLSIDKEWVKHPYLISLYLTLLRDNENIEKFNISIESFNDCITKIKIHPFVKYSKVLNIILENKNISFDSEKYKLVNWDSIGTTDEAHNSGVLSFYDANVNFINSK